MLDALVFDFDGLILDTETPLYEAWSRTFEHFGACPIGLDEWCESLGRHDDDPALLRPLERLEALLGRRLDAAEVHAVRRRARDDLLAAVPLQPGVVELLDRAEALGIAVGIATSSPSDWVDEHLDARGLGGRFAFVSCPGPGVPGKPSPEVYQRACAALGVGPAGSLALEDSPNGLAAAKAAGLRCVVVPTGISRSLDFAGADAVVSSLLEVSLPDW